MSFPTDDELLEAITALRPLHPKLGRKQFRALLKDTYSWERLSETRLKKVLDENDLNATPLIKNTTPETLERDEKFKAVVKNAFLDFKVRERDFFMGLKSRQAKILGGGTYVGRLRRSTYLRHHVEFLLTMKEIKPCTLFTHTCGESVITFMVQKCLKPVFERYKLAKYGFLLQQITHPMPTTGRSQCKSRPFQFLGAFTFHIHS